MTALCIEKLSFNNGRSAPRLALDAALPSNASGKLIADGPIAQVLDLLRGLLDDATFKKVEGPLMNLSKMSMDQPAPRTFKPKPENVEAAADLLRSHGVDGATIAQFYKICGIEPGQAQDCARRSYAARFPDAGQIGGDAKLPTPSSATSYAERFPGAARIRVL